MQISAGDLRHVVNKLLDHLEDTGHDVLVINKDYYWVISAIQRYDPYKEPTDFTLGQLSDDWSELEKTIRGECAPVGYALVWLSAILRAIGEENVA